MTKAPASLDTSKLLDAAVSEVELQRRVVQLAKNLHWKVVHFRPAQSKSGRWMTAMQGDPGFPDLVLANGKRVLFVELKSQKGRMEDEQHRWLDCLRVTGVAGPVQTFIWRPSDWRTGAIEAVLRGEM